MKNTKTILFVCTAGRLRSKTAADYLNQQKISGYRFLSCGTDIEFVEEWNARHPEGDQITPINADLIDSADAIYCMQIENAQIVWKLKPNAFVNLLDWPDVFDYMESRLISLIRALVPSIIDNESRKQSDQKSSHCSECWLLGRVSGTGV